ncbi:SDR family oxidoreductase [Kistimonas asteriae]|uniref:SDR family oxidoreductase n=1 Tax=Kistimonas asteriae TaxID=517724 RepID=UPI001BAAE4CB|nr:SDR family oxidoreductase [Kistimonas asteriae]
MHRRFLLTGATGLIGSSIISLLEDSDEVCILVRNSRFFALPRGVTLQLDGDITLPEFGFNHAVIKQLKSIDCIIHSAANTDFNASDNALYSTNVVGLVQAQGLARKLKVPLIYISTAFVRKNTDDCMNNYELSKTIAESKLDQSVTVVRPSIVIGKSSDGVMPRIQGFHRLLRYITRSSLPILPCSSGATVDAIPCDIVGKSILHIYDNQLSGEHWITAGEKSINIKDLIMIEADRKDVDFVCPKFIDPDMYERLIKPVFIPNLDRRNRLLYQRIANVITYFSNNSIFASTIPKLGEYLSEWYGRYDLREQILKDVRMLG